LNNYYSLNLTNLNAISPGKDVPREINVVIEIPKGSSVKYEIDVESGIIYVDRKLSASMIYPGNYGFVPQTKTEDGDHVDVVIMDSEPLIPACVVDVRPIGVLSQKTRMVEIQKLLQCQQKMSTFLVFKILKMFQSLRSSSWSTFSNTIKTLKRVNSSK
jgi:inorganic pyrophosphatase